MEKLDSTWTANGDTLLILTYHSDCADAPEHLYYNGLQERAKHYYDMGSAGVVANGIGAGAVNFVQEQIFEQNPIGQSAALTLSSTVSSTDSNTVAITVKADAREDIPEGMKLHIIISESVVDWAVIWADGVDAEGKVKNGQATMIDLAWDIIEDTLGNDFPAIKAGASHSMTHSFTLDPVIQNRENIEVTAILQNLESRAIYAAVRMKGSPYHPITAIKKSSSSQIKPFDIALSGGSVSFVAPFDNATVSLYNAVGAQVSQRKVSQRSGQMVSFALPTSVAQGILFMQVEAPSGEKFVKHIVMQ